MHSPVILLPVCSFSRYGWTYYGTPFLSHRLFQVSSLLATTESSVEGLRLELAAGQRAHSAQLEEAQKLLRRDREAALEGQQVAIGERDAARAERDAAMEQQRQSSQEEARLGALALGQVEQARLQLESEVQSLRSANTELLATRAVTAPSEEKAAGEAGRGRSMLPAVAVAQARVVSLPTSFPNQAQALLLSISAFNRGCREDWARLPDIYICSKQQLRSVAAAALGALPGLIPQATGGELRVLLEALGGLTPGTGWVPEPASLEALDSALVLVLGGTATGCFPGSEEAVAEGAWASGGMAQLLRLRAPLGPLSPSLRRQVDEVVLTRASTGPAARGYSQLLELASLCGLLEVAALVHPPAPGSPDPPGGSGCSGDEGVRPWEDVGILAWAAAGPLGASAAASATEQRGAAGDGLDVGVLFNKAYVALAMASPDDPLWRDAEFLTR